MRRSGALSTAWDLAAAALCIAWRVFSGAFEQVMRWCACAVMEVEYCLLTKWNVGSWLGGFEWPILVGVDGFAHGKTGS
ncbi:hypothetical protein EAH_00065540 [Eimeria acervulina]|uniref:Secreted protein n=1 Tax=Eimeria acervulina TaxID=5801 RepID=U6GRQ9_EIMAC|nr:hypothetical protein EAH_00065540 [Eimeria acervulina]CDI82252.1 hypothetical protein EAH_00065540 [Eimeria acervulina]